MIDQFERLNAMLRPQPLSNNLFPPNSRYFGIETAVLEVDPEHPIVYLRRRFVPQPEQFSLLQTHTVSQGERPDTVAAQFLGDPEQFWRLCDANRVLRPEELTETPGRQLRITLPEGLQGAING